MTTERRIRPTPGNRLVASDELDDLRDFFEQAAVAIHWVAADGTILRANRAELALLGYEEHEYVGRNIAEFHADGAVIADILARLTRGETLHDYAARLRAKDGSLRDVLIDSSALFRDGKFVHSRCFTRDNSERNAAERALIESEHRWQLLTDSMSALVATTDGRGVIQYVNRRWTEYSGLTGAELRERWRDVIHPDDIDALQAAWRNALKSGQSMENEFRVLRVDGAWRWHHSITSPVVAADGTVTMWVDASTDVDDSHRAQEEALLANVRLNALFDSSPLPTMALDLHGNVTMWNPACERLFGYTLADVIGRPSQIVPEDRQEEFISLLASATRGERVQGVPTVRRTKDGRLIEVQTSYAPVTIDDRTVGAIGIIQDQTERKLAELALTRQADLLEQTHDAILVWRLGGSIRYWNRAAEQLYGYSRQEAGGRISHELLLTEHPEGYAAFEAELLRLGEWRGELTHTKRDGAKIVVESHHVLLDADPRGRRFVLETARDITERKHTEDEVREAEERYRFALDAAALGSWVWDLQTNETIWSDRLFEILGYEPGSISPTFESFTERVHADDREYARSSANRAIELRQDHRAEFRFVRPDGDLRWLATWGRLQYNDAGEPVRMLGVIQDITSRMRTLEELTRANDAKDEFLGLVSHELRTPITTIYGNARILAQHGDQLDEEDRTGALTDIENEADRLQRIIENLLILARFDATQTIETEPVRIEEAIRSVVAVYRRRLPGRAIDLDLEPDLPLVEVQPTYLELVLTNLINNADKYSPPGAAVEIFVKRSGMEVEVKICDRGTGVLPEELEELFSPFYRSTRTKALAGGMGIGLAVCRRIMEAQGCRIWAKPRHDGGTEFGFSLPLEGGRDA